MYTLLFILYSTVVYLYFMYIYILYCVMYVIYSRLRIPPKAILNMPQVSVIYK